MHSINYSISTIKGKWSKKWGAYPNLGIGKTEPQGKIDLIHTDDNFLKLFYSIGNSGGSLMGGCCGSSPRHISLLHNKFREYINFKSI